MFLNILKRGSKLNGRMKECSTYMITRWLKLKFVKISQKKNNEIKTVKRNRKLGE